jgi:hypothetical protein
MKNTIISIFVASALVIFAIIFTSGKTETQNKSVNDGISDDGIGTVVNNVSIVDGKQIIEIQARGGYTPRKSIAKSGIPTIVRFNTKGTFDCSSSIRIPSLSIFKSLPQSGVTDIDLGSQKAGVLQGSCGMGMYPFEIEFKE